MALPVLKEPVDARLPEPNEVHSAGEAFTALAPLVKGNAPVCMQISSGALSGEAVLAPEVARALAQVLHYYALGQAVTLVPVGSEMTTQQAADVLNVSRPYVCKLIDEGALPASKVGRHRRIPANVVLAYKQRRDKQRREALDELFAADADEI